MKFIKDKNILNCEKMNNPPVGDTSIGADGFNIDLDSMIPNQQYVFRDWGGAKIYIRHCKDNIWNMIQISDEPFKIENKAQQSFTGVRRDQ